MDISGTYTFDASTRSRLGLLMDPAVIASCIPGCDAFEPDGEDRYRARLTVALAAITGTYDGTVTLSDKVPHRRSYRLTAEGQGRPGFVKGTRRSRCGRRRRTTDRRRHRHGADRWPDRAPRSAADRRRVEDDAGPFLRLHAVEARARS